MSTLHSWPNTIDHSYQLPSIQFYAIPWIWGWSASVCRDQWSLNYFPLAICNAKKDSRWLVNRKHFQSWLMGQWTRNPFSLQSALTTTKRHWLAKAIPSTGRPRLGSFTPMHCLRMSECKLDPFWVPNTDEISSLWRQSSLSSTKLLSQASLQQEFFPLDYTILLFLTS